MILQIISFISILSIYLYCGSYIYKSNKKNNVNSSIVKYFYIAYFIIFIILCNTYLLTFFYSKISNKTGPTGPTGVKGNMGETGIKGKCEFSCVDKECNIKLIEVIHNKYNKLLKEIDGIDKEINIKKEIKNIKTQIVMKTVLKNNMLNNLVDSLCVSKQYLKAIKDSNKTVDEVNNYIYSIFEKWIEIIYKSLPKKDRISENENNNFFISTYSNIDNTEWLNDKNPFEEISKYDIYNWGMNRTFKPKYIKIDNNPNNVNYLPQDSKPPLKILYSNNYEFIYNNSINNTRRDVAFIQFNENIPTYMYLKDKPNNKFKINQLSTYEWEYIRNNISISFSSQINAKIRSHIEDFIEKPLKIELPHEKDTYPDNKVSIWQNRGSIKYRKENYYPVSNLVIGPNNNYKSTSEKEIIDPDEKYYKVKKYTYNSIQNNNDKKKDRFEFSNPKKSTILITGDVENPEEYYKLWDNSNSYEQNNVSIWRPICPEGYESLSDVAVKGFKKPKKDTIKCVPKVCLEKNTNEEKTLFKTFDNNELIGYSDNNNLNYPSNENSFNAFRYKDKDESKNTIKGFRNNLYTINEDCLTTKNTVTKPVETKYGRIGLGWNGRPLRQPKYSIFSYLVQMPEAIISNKATNYKYYIIHTELYNMDSKTDANFKTSAKNLYYVLVLNFRTNKYDRCLSINGKSEIIRTTLRNELEAYWEIEPVKNNSFDEIRLKSAKTGRYLYHDRNINLRRDLVKNRVFEKQKPLNKKTKNENSMIFVNVKSSFGTNIQTALEDGEPRLEEKYYKNYTKNKTNKYNDDYKFEKRGIQN